MKKGEAKNDHNSQKSFWSVVEGIHVLGKKFYKQSLTCIVFPPETEKSRVRW